MGTGAPMGSCSYNSMVHGCVTSLPNSKIYIINNVIILLFLYLSRLSLYRFCIFFSDGMKCNFIFDQQRAADHLTLCHFHKAPSHEELRAKCVTCYFETEPGRERRQKVTLDCSVFPPHSDAFEVSAVDELKINLSPRCVP